MIRTLQKTDPITLVELQPTQYGKLDGEPSYDMYSQFRITRALPQLTALLMSKGYTNVQMISPIIHGENGKFSEKNMQRAKNSVFVGISNITRTLYQSWELGDILKDKMVCFGGMGSSKAVEETLNRGDMVVIGEGENTLTELLERLEKTTDLSGIAGLAFKRDGKIEIGERRANSTQEEFDNLPLPYYDEETIRKTNVTPVEQQRGCPHGCYFCVVTDTFGRKIRYHTPERVAEEIKRDRKLGMPRTIFLTGDNLGGIPRKALEVLNEIYKRGLYRDGITAQVDAGFAKNPELMQAARNAGVRHLCVGLESFTNDSLEAVGKPFTAEQNIAALKRFKEFGFWVHGMFICGLDGDTPKTLKETLKLAKEYTSSAQFFTPIPIPGTGFHDEMQKQRRILTKDWSLYDGQHVVLRPVNFYPDELQETVFEMYDDYYSARSTLMKIFTSPVPKNVIEFGIYAKLYGGRRIMRNKQTREHLETLRALR